MTGRVTQRTSGRIGFSPAVRFARTGRRGEQNCIMWSRKRTISQQPSVIDKNASITRNMIPDNAQDIHTSRLPLAQDGNPCQEPTRDRMRESFEGLQLLMFIDGQGTALRAVRDGKPGRQQAAPAAYGTGTGSHPAAAGTPPHYPRHSPERLRRKPAWGRPGPLSGLPAGAPVQPRNWFTTRVAAPFPPQERPRLFPATPTSPGTPAHKGLKTAQPSVPSRKGQLSCEATDESTCTPEYEGETRFEQAFMPRMSLAGRRWAVSRVRSCEGPAPTNDYPPRPGPRREGRQHVEREPSQGQGLNHLATGCHRR